MRRMLLAVALAACSPPDPVERVGGRVLPDGRPPPCVLPESVRDLPVPPVDLDDLGSMYATDSLPLIEVFLPEGAWADACDGAKRVADWMHARAFGDTPVEPLQRPLVRVSVAIQDRFWTDVGFRFRGQSNLFAMFYDRWGGAIPGALDACKADRMAKKASYRLDFDAFDPGRRVAGQRALDLGGREGADASYLREVTMQHMARDFGLPAPLVSHARVCRDGVYDGVFSFAEEVDRRGILDRLFPGEDEGGYWEIVSPADQAWRSGWTQETGWQSVYEPLGSTPDDDPGALADLLDAGSAVRDGLDPGDLDAILDVDTWLKNIALDMTAPDYDGMTGNHKNHTLYAHPTRGIVPVSFDKDLALLDLGDYLYGLCAGSIWGANPCWSRRKTPPFIVQWLLDHRPDDYTARVRDLLDGPMDPGTLLPWIAARRDTIRPWVYADRYYQPDGPACEADPEHCQWYTPDGWEYEAGPFLESNITERVAEVRRQLDGVFLCGRSCSVGELVENRPPDG